MGVSLGAVGGLVLTGRVQPSGLWRLLLWCGWWSCGSDGEHGDLPAQTSSLHPDESSCCAPNFCGEKQSPRQREGRNWKVVFEAWKEMTGWQASEAAHNLMKLKFQNSFNVICHFMMCFSCQQRAWTQYLTTWQETKEILGLNFFISTTSITYYLTILLENMVNPGEVNCHFCVLTAVQPLKSYIISYQSPFFQPCLLEIHMGQQQCIIAVSLTTLHD